MSAKLIVSRAEKAYRNRVKFHAVIFLVDFSIHAPHMTGDPQTNLSQLRNTVRQFVRERDWNQFHSPKNLVMALSVEVAELMEHFQWISVEDSRSLDGEKLVEVGEEMADVFCYLMALANELDLDLTSTFFRKMELNRIKYPASEYRGRFGDGDPNPVQPGK